MKSLLCPLLFAAALVSAADKPTKIPESVLRSSYRITASQNGRDADVGSGIAIDKHHLLTANHVVTASNDTKVDIFDRDGIYLRSIPAKVVREDKDNDLALLEVEADLPESHTLDYGDAKVGDPAYAIGAAWGDAPYSTSSGTVVSKSNQDFKAYWQISATIACGMSGGGVYSADHKFLGIMVRGAPIVGGLFVPAATVKNFLNQKAKPNDK
jgi:S1-C subfamily serine protease